MLRRSNKQQDHHWRIDSSYKDVRRHHSMDAPQNERFKWSRRTPSLSAVAVVATERRAQMTVQETAVKPRSMKESGTAESFQWSSLKCASCRSHAALSFIGACLSELRRRRSLRVAAGAVDIMDESRRKLVVWSFWSIPQSEIAEDIASRSVTSRYEAAQFFAAGRSPPLRTRQRWSQDRARGHHHEQR